MARPRRFFAMLQQITSNNNNEFWSRRGNVLTDPNFVGSELRYDGLQVALFWFNSPNFNSELGHVGNTGINDDVAAFSGLFP